MAPKNNCSKSLIRLEKAAVVAFLYKTAQAQVFSHILQTRMGACRRPLRQGGGGQPRERAAVRRAERGVAVTR